MNPTSRMAGMGGSSGAGSGLGSALGAGGGGSGAGTGGGSGAFGGANKLPTSTDSEEVEAGGELGIDTGSAPMRSVSLFMSLLEAGLRLIVGIAAAVVLGGRFAGGLGESLQPTSTASAAVVATILMRDISS
jgi:hypothetical protein